MVGRGIKVCDKWMIFNNFFSDMGEPPTKEHSLDRIDNNGNYHQTNCRWATKKQQQGNMRSNHQITFNDKTQCIAKWSRETGIGQKCLWHRLTTLGWPIQRALTKPVQIQRKRRKV